MTGYVRADTGNDIDNGEVVDADVLDSEFNAITAAFHSSTGHKHDGTTAEGAPITVLGPAQEFVASASTLRPKVDNFYDLATDVIRYKDGYFAGTVRSAAIRATSSSGAGFIGPSAVAIASAPHFTWDGDSNTGMYRSASDTIKFATAGNERMGIASDGTVSITGALTVAGNITGAVVGNASTATSAATLTTARTIAIGTGATGTATSFNGSANITIPITAVDATYLTNTIAEARLPTTATAWLRTLTAAAQSLGAVGTYAFLKNLDSQTLAAGEIASGSNLRYSGSENNSSGTPAGSWMCLGRAIQNESTLFVRTV
jgi:hypothetical protein